ncbi:MAG TPA: transporter substrate-binding domain-containing protein [Casimicrobiaceae bacterium]|nr:transporter substrate-binding domain-containing protein [Casimicrobiaceae bacterium]
MKTSRMLEVVSKLIVLLSIVALPLAAAAGTLEDVKKRGELIVGVRYDMPPFGSVDQQGSVRGIDIELAKQIANKLGVGIKFQQVTAQTRIPMLINGNVDLIAAGMAKTEERAKVVQFSSIYIETGTVFLVLKDSPIRSWQDVKGKTVATVQGSSYLGLLRQKTTDFQSLAFQEYPQAILAVEQGRADTLMVEDATAVNLIKGREDKFKLVGRPRDFEAYEVGLGMRKNDEEWVKYVNQVLSDLWKSGELKRIVAPYGLVYDPDFKI